MLDQLGKYKVKDMTIYIDPRIDELLKLWDGVTMYGISRPIGKRRFQFHGILGWTIHDAPGLTHFVVYFYFLLFFNNIYILKISCIILNGNSNSLH